MNHPTNFICGHSFTKLTHLYCHTWVNNCVWWVTNLDCDKFRENEYWLQGCLATNGQSNTQGVTQFDSLQCNDDSAEDEEKKPTSPHPFRRGSKPHSTPLTLKWLEENYEIAEGVCIPRSTLYLHYLDFCEMNDTNPVNAASFGKIIRQQFPQITTRRLGTRGQSKYHYYGIGVRESSNYYEVMYSAKAVQTSSEGKKDTTKQVVAYSPRSKLGTLLPVFPDVSVIKLPSDIEEHKVVTFLMMYRTHCQRILDTVIRANFDEVQNFLLHFWQGMPTHIIPILGNDVVVKLIGVCDSILYKAVAGVLMPTVLQALPDSLTQVIRTFARQLEEWLKLALEGLPNTLQAVKIDLSRRFSQVLRRQMSLNHLVQASRTVVNSPVIMTQLLADWLNIDLNSIVKQTLYTMDHYTERDHMVIVELCTEFEKLLDEQAPMEAYVDWLDNMVQCCVIKASQKRTGSLKSIARQFLLMWSCFGTRVIRDMTLHSAPSFGSFHLLHLMFDDYVLYLIETLHSDERASEFLKVIKGEIADSDVMDDAILPDPALVRESFTSCWSADRGNRGGGGGGDGGGGGRNSGGGSHSVSAGCLLRGDTFFDYDSQSDCYSSEDDSLDHSPIRMLNEVTQNGINNACMRSQVMAGTSARDNGVMFSYSGSHLQQQQHQQQQHHQHPHQHQPQQLQPQQQHPFYNNNNSNHSQSVFQHQSPTAGVQHEGFVQTSCYPNNAALRGTMVTKDASHNQSAWACASRDRDPVLTGVDLRSSPQQGPYLNHNLYHSSRQICLTTAAPTVYQFTNHLNRTPQHNMAAVADAHYGYQGYGAMPQEMTSSFITGNAAVKRKQDRRDEEGEELRHGLYAKRLNSSEFQHQEPGHPANFL